LQHALKILDYLIVPKSQEAPTVTLEPSSAFDLIFAHATVLAAIEFNDQR